MDWADERARLLAPIAPKPVVKDVAYFEARCWFHDCEELRDPNHEKWCTVHLANRPAEVERAVEWLESLGYTA